MYLKLQSGVTRTKWTCTQNLNEHRIFLLFCLCTTVYSLGLSMNESDQVRAGTARGRGTAEYSLCEGVGLPVAYTLA